MFLIIILICLGPIVGFYLGKGFSKPSETKKDTPQPTPTQQITQSVFPTVDPNELNSGEQRVEIYALSNQALQKTFEYSLPGSSIFGVLKPSLGKDNKLYFADNSRILRYSFDAKNVEKVYELSNPNEAITKIEALFTPNMYITKGPKEYGENYEFTVEEFNLLTKAKREFGPIPPGIYSNTAYIYKYGNSDIVSSFGGDGCGGGGPIYKYTGNQKTEIVTIGFGCADGPGYVGVLEEKGSLLLVDRNVNMETGDFPSETLLTLYELPLNNTNSKNEIFNFSSTPVEKGQLVLNSNKKTVGIISSSEIWIINLQSKEVIKKLTVASFPNHQLFLNGNILYGIDFNDKKIIMLDLDTGTQKDIVWGNVLPANSAPIFLGTSNNTLLLYTVIYKQQN